MEILGRLEVMMSGVVKASGQRCYNRLKSMAEGSGCEREEERGQEKGRRTEISF